MNYAHHHCQVHCEEQLVEAACHALGGNSGSKPCSELSEDHRPGFPESLQLSAQLDWILSGISPCRMPAFVPSTVIPITPLISWLQMRIERLRAVGYPSQGYIACVWQDPYTSIYYNITAKEASLIFCTVLTVYPKISPG